MTILCTLLFSAGWASLMLWVKNDGHGHSFSFWGAFFTVLMFPGFVVFILSFLFFSSFQVDTVVQSKEIKQYKLLPIATEKPNIYVFRTDNLDPKEIKYEFKYKENNEFLTNGVLISESVVYFDSKPGEAYISKMEVRKIRTSKISEMLLSSWRDEYDLLVFDYYEIHLPPKHTEV